MNYIAPVLKPNFEFLCTVQMLWGRSPISIYPWHNFSSDCACLNKNVWEPAKRVEWLMTAVKNVARSNASVQFWYAFLLSTLGLLKIWYSTNNSFNGIRKFMITLKKLGKKSAFLLLKWDRQIRIWGFFNQVLGYLRSAAIHF